jgi:hypothetical protein
MGVYGVWFRMPGQGLEGYGVWFRVSVIGFRGLWTIFQVVGFRVPR